MFGLGRQLLSPKIQSVSVPAQLVTSVRIFFSSSILAEDSEFVGVGFIVKAFQCAIWREKCFHVKFVKPSNLGPSLLLERQSQFVN